MRSKSLYYKVFRVVLILMLLIIALNLQAQLDTVSNPAQFVFPEFSVGVVKMKTGEKIILNLNYNVLTEKMVFKQKNRIYDIVNTDAIDTVYIQEVKFVPMGKAFYEVLVSGPSSLFYQHAGDLKKPSRPAAYGGTTEVSSSTYINNLRLGNDVYRMEKNKEVVIEEKSVIWIRKSNSMYAVTDKKHLFAALPDKKEELKQYIRKNQVKIDNPYQMTDLIKYYNGLLR
ncbi:MAG: hypothetical protein NTZ85_14180 [Bacteroidia bacterium]|nr:hypothetical protein [Bacteroidia bacterium]